MADFDQYALFSATVSLVRAFKGTPGFLKFDPWRENLGGTKVVLELAKSLGGSDTGGFI
jgi:hypothetical protein